MKANSQVSRLKDWLDSDQPITRLQSFTELGIIELSSRIGELISSGYAISKEPIKVLNRFDEQVRVMQYKRAA